MLSDVAGKLTELTDSSSTAPIGSGLDSRYVDSPASVFCWNPTDAIDDEEFHRPVLLFEPEPQLAFDSLK